MYTAAHAKPNGPGDARPTAKQILNNEDGANRFKDKVVLITGGTNGIGVETARAFATTGARVFITARDLTKAKSVIANIQSTCHEQVQIEALELDLESLDSVKQCARDFLSKSNKLNVLICNAGIMAVGTLTRTKDGFESQFGVNHVSHFLLVQLLKDALLRSSTSEFQSRLVLVSSGAHRFSPILFDDYDLVKRGYDPWVAYGQSKTANIYTALEIERRYGSQGLHAWAVCPGTLSQTLLRSV